MKLLTVASCGGVILSIGAAVYTIDEYLALSRSAEIIELLSRSEDLMAPKIEAAFIGHENLEPVLTELKVRRDQNASLRFKMAEIVASSKNHALNESLLWIGSVTLFSALFVKAASRRHSN